MKKLFALMILLPVLSFAQDVEQNKPYTPKNEIGVSTGIAPSFLNSFSGTEVWLTTRLTYLHNFNNTQIGLIAEGGSIDWYDGNIIVAGVLNKKFPVGKSYLYAGGSAGYYHGYEMEQLGGSFGRNDRGYTLGLQAGFSLHLSNRFSFVSEIGVRSTQVWFENYHYYPATATSFYWQEAYIEKYIDNRFSISLPATMGIRYRF